MYVTGTQNDLVACTIPLAAPEVSEPYLRAPEPIRFKIKYLVTDLPRRAPKALVRRVKKVKLTLFTVAHCAYFYGVVGEISEKPLLGWAGAACLVLTVYSTLKGGGE